MGKSKPVSVQLPADDEEAEVFGLMNAAQNVSPKELNESESTIMFLAIDGSGSMEQYADVMREELAAWKLSILGAHDAGQILVARASFNDHIDIGGYQWVKDFNTDYTATGETRLYDVIIDGAQKLQEYASDLRASGGTVKAVFAVFSDGQDTASSPQHQKLEEAKHAIKDLNDCETVTAFIAFGADGENLARNTLRFKNVAQYGRDEHDLRKLFEVLSKSLVSQSKSATAKTSNFFF